MSEKIEVESEGWWNDEHNIYTWPITVNEWGSRIECHGRSPVEAKALAFRVADSMITQASQVPEGFALVPVEPTPEMLAEIHLVESFTQQALIARYKAMLSAAPKGCTKPGCFPYCDCGTIDDYMPLAAAPKGDSHE